MAAAGFRPRYLLTERWLTSCRGENGDTVCEDMYPDVVQHLRGKEEKSVLVEKIVLVERSIT